jgi:hypothetical protein
MGQWTIVQEQVVLELVGCCCGYALGFVLGKVSVPGNITLYIFQYNF